MIVLYVILFFEDVKFIFWFLEVKYFGEIIVKRFFWFEKYLDVIFRINC